MRLVIAGASGYIGRSLVRLAVERGHEVLMLVRRRDEGLAGYGVQQNIDDAMALDGLAADALINVAGSAHVRGTALDFDAANVQLPSRLAACVLDGRVDRMIQLSSLGVYGNWSIDPITERTAPAPDTVYACSKLNADIHLAERFRSMADRLSIVRPPMVFGPACPGNFARLRRLVASGLPLPFGAAHARRSFIFVTNLADFLLRCSEASSPGGLFVIGDGSDYGVFELIRQIALAGGKPVTNVAVPLPGLRALATVCGMRRTMDSLTRPMTVDWARAREVIGWTPPVSPHDAMRLATASR